MTLLHRLPSARPKAVAALAVAGALTLFAGSAAAQKDEIALDRGGKADVTAQQRYDSAIREAGGGLKVALAECRQQGSAGAERKACEAGAQQRYKADMQQAQEMRRNPQVRPVEVTGEPIRSTETTTIIRP